MNYLLDTNTCIAIMKRHPSVLTRVEECKTEPPMLCSPVKAELWYGIFKSTRRERNLSRLLEFFAFLPSLPFDDQAAEIYGQLRAELTRQGTPIGPNDLLIAAVALAHGVTLVTHNTREFARVPGLRIEDWQQ
ncbi:MAG: type II toxin-antitoxin system VapC family toxin [Magnetococcales bacterium]|nr:type II toxin-antitoxin system VapC family toxin [Magnetococcales bacterium]MBF0150474.1 type II toxin-antitoxin system VapC family toxin [Magnetococcales bacterium]